MVEFNEWLGVLPHRHKIVIAGNHEMALDELKHSPAEIKALFTNATYLQDDEITVEGSSRAATRVCHSIFVPCVSHVCAVCAGIRIYGAPWIARNKFFLLPSLKWALSTGIGSMGLGFAMSSVRRACPRPSHSFRQMRTASPHRTRRTYVTEKPEVVRKVEQHTRGR